MVGTPPVIATFSRSMISIACTGSHLRMKIVVLPPAIVPISPAEQAVTWNMGMTVRLVRGCGSGTGSPRRRKLRAARSGERRVGKGGDGTCRSWWYADHEKKQQK